MVSDGSTAQARIDALVRAMEVVVAGIYNSANVLLRRFVFGPAIDEPLVWYEGAGTSDRRQLDADDQGSVVRVTSAAGSTMQVNTYDEYGVPSSSNLGRFGYTGQVYLSEIGMYDYRSRIYNPNIGSFMQPDPIGQEDGPNLYSYVKADPVNHFDPNGTECWDHFTYQVDRKTGAYIENSLQYVNSSGDCSITFTYPPGWNGITVVPEGYSGGGSGSGSSGQTVAFRAARPEEIVVSCDAACRGRNLGLDRMKNDKWVLVGGRYLLNPYYVQPWYDIGLDGFLKLQIAGFAVAASPGIPLLTARGVGLLNSNNLIRWGYNWKGTAMNGATVFRLAIGKWHIWDYQ